MQAFCTLKMSKILKSPAILSSYNYFKDRTLFFVINSLLLLLLLLYHYFVCNRSRVCLCVCVWLCQIWHQPAVHSLLPVVRVHWSCHCRRHRSHRQLHYRCGTSSYEGYTESFLDTSHGKRATAKIQPNETILISDTSVLSNSVISKCTFQNSHIVQTFY